MESASLQALLQRHLPTASTEQQTAAIKALPSLTGKIGKRTKHFESLSVQSLFKDCGKTETDAVTHFSKW